MENNVKQKNNIIKLINLIRIACILLTSIVLFICVLYPMVWGNLLGLEEALTSGCILAGIILIVEIANIVIADYRG